MTELEEPASARLVAFISHHSSQHPAARKLKALLARDGIDAWMAPDDVDPGVTFDQAIIDQIARSDVIILLFCASADNSRHVKRELMLAEDKGKPIYPVRLEDIPPRGLAYWLQDYQWIDWIGGGDEQIDRLIATIRRRGMPADQTAPPSAPPAASPGKRRRWKPVLAGLLGLVILAAAGLAWVVWPRISAPAYVLQPGRWISRREVVQVVYPEMGPEMSRQLEQSFENDPNPEECISEEVARAPNVALFDPGGEGHCTLTSFEMAAGRMSGYIACPIPGATDGSAMQVTFRGSYTLTTIDLENDITLARPGNLIRLRARDTNRWVARDCAPGR